MMTVDDDEREQELTEHLETLEQLERAEQELSKAQVTIEALTRALSKQVARTKELEQQAHLLRGDLQRTKAQHDEDVAALRQRLRQQVESLREDHARTETSLEEENQLLRQRCARLEREYEAAVWKAEHEDAVNKLGLEDAFSRLLHVTSRPECKAVGRRLSLLVQERGASPEQQQWFAASAWIDRLTGTLERTRGSPLSVTAVAQLCRIPAFAVRLTDSTLFSCLHDVYLLYDSQEGEEGLQPPCGRGADSGSAPIMSQHDPADAAGNAPQGHSEEGVQEQEGKEEGVDHDRGGKSRKAAAAAAVKGALAQRGQATVPLRFQPRGEDRNTVRQLILQALHSVLNACEALLPDREAVRTFMAAPGALPLLSLLSRSFTRDTGPTFGLQVALSVITKLSRRLVVDPDLLNTLAQHGIVTAVINLAHLPSARLPAVNVLLLMAGDASANTLLVKCDTVQVLLTTARTCGAAAADIDTEAKATTDSVLTALRQLTTALVPESRASKQKHEGTEQGQPDDAQAEDRDRGEEDEAAVDASAVQAVLRRAEAIGPLGTVFAILRCLCQLSTCDEFSATFFAADGTATVNFLLSRFSALPELHASLAEIMTRALLPLSAHDLEKCDFSPAHASVLHSLQHLTMRNAAVLSAALDVACRQMAAHPRQAARCISSQALISLASTVQALPASSPMAYKCCYFLLCYAGTGEANVRFLLDNSTFPLLLHLCASHNLEVRTWLSHVFLFLCRACVDASIAVPRHQATLLLDRLKQLLDAHIKEPEPKAEEGLSSLSKALYTVPLLLSEDQISRSLLPFLERCEHMPLLHKRLIQPVHHTTATEASPMQLVKTAIRLALSSSAHRKCLYHFSRAIEFLAAATSSATLLDEMDKLCLAVWAPALAAQEEEEEEETTADMKDATATARDVHNQTLSIAAEAGALASGAVAAATSAAVANVGTGESAAVGSAGDIATHLLVGRELEVCLSSAMVAVLVAAAATGPGHRARKVALAFAHASSAQLSHFARAIADAKGLGVIADVMETDNDAFNDGASLVCHALASCPATAAHVLKQVPLRQLLEILANAKDDGLKATLSELLPTVFEDKEASMQVVVGGTVTHVMAMVETSSSPLELHTCVAVLRAITAHASAVKPMVQLGLIRTLSSLHTGVAAPYFRDLLQGQEGVTEEDMAHFESLARETESTFLSLLGHHKAVAQALYEDGLLPLLATILMDDRHSDAVLAGTLSCLALACQSPLMAAGALDGECVEALVKWFKHPVLDVEDRTREWSEHMRRLARHALVNAAWCCTASRRRSEEDALRLLFTCDAVDAFIASIDASKAAPQATQGQGRVEADETQAVTDISQEHGGEALILLPEGEVLRRALWACAAWLMQRERGARGGFIRRGGLRALMELAEGDSLSAECSRYTRACLSHLLGVMGEELTVRISVLRAHMQHHANPHEVMIDIASQVDAGERQELDTQAHSQQGNKEQD